MTSDKLGNLSDPDEEKTALPSMLGRFLRRLSKAAHARLEECGVVQRLAVNPDCATEELCDLGHVARCLASSARGTESIQPMAR